MMAFVVLEIASLLWSHPILTGLVILLFTTPLFHIVLFFTPLLMSTALCVIALISIGPQIEKIREERQFKMSLNARNVALPVERPVNRCIVIRQGRPQRPPMRLVGGPGGRRWSDWVKGIEIHGHTVWLSESHIMRDIAEEGLNSDFSHEQDGGIPFTAEEPLPKGGAFISDNTPEVKTESVEDATTEEQQLQIVPSTETQEESQELVKMDQTPCLSPEANYMEFIPETASPTEKKRKKAPWFRRRRIPCLSKALGQLREKICNQLRRIFC